MENVAVETDSVQGKFLPTYSAAFDKVSQLLDRAVEDEVFPGAVLLVGRAGHELYRRTVGLRTASSAKVGEVSPMRFDTVFDIASLTSTMITTTMIMKFVELEKICLEDKLPRFISEFSVHGKSQINIGQLLCHSSGLPHWHPYFEELLKEQAAGRMGVLTSRGARDYIFNSIKRCLLKYDVGSKQVYSDLGFMLLGHIIEMLTGTSLDKAVSQFVLGPLGLKTTSFIDLSMIKRRGIHPVKDLIAPTEDCSWRKRVLCGEVHDDNAWAMGGIAGHAGIFSSASDVHRFASEMIDAYHGRSNYLTRETVRRFWTGPMLGDEQVMWHFGWEAPNSENGMSESNLSARAVGACGFTGCSLWIEPETGLDIVLMSNRINPSRSNKKIRLFRPELHDAVLEAVGQ